jgi:hypothetical protein
MVMSVDAATDFDLQGKVEDTQARDKETGHRVWTVTVIDMDEDENAKFRRSSELKVRIVAPVRPVPPPSQVPGYKPLVEFEGLTLTPYMDSQKCAPAKKGEAHKCRSRLAYSLRASDMVPFLGVAVQ